MAGSVAINHVLAAIVSARPTFQKSVARLIAIVMGQSTARKRQLRCMADTTIARVAIATANANPTRSIVIHVAEGIVALTKNQPIAMTTVQL